MRKVSMLLVFPAMVLTVSPARSQIRPVPVLSATFVRADRPVVDTLPYEEDPSGPILGAFMFGGIGVGVACLTQDLDAVLLFESLGIGLGAHFGNGGRGSLGASLLASLGVMAAARLIAARTGATGEWVLVVPMLQITASVVAETATARGRRRR